jgi:lysophospholipase L1-like esterase
MGSVAFFPLVAVQGTVTRRRVPCLPTAQPPYHGVEPGAGSPIRILAIGDSTVAGVGVAHGRETVAATTARALSRATGRSVAWRAHGVSGATAQDAMKSLLPGLPSEPADLLIVAFGVNDVVAYRSPAAFADDLSALVTAARIRVGPAAAVITGVAPVGSFPALPWPLRTILNWRAAALQAAADRLVDCLPRIAVERFGMAFEPHLFADDGFHPNLHAHNLWGEEVATIALPLLAERDAQAADAKQTAPAA